MTDEHGSQNFRENDPPDETLILTSDITPSQEQQIPHVRIPQSLIEWLARVNRRYLALDQREDQDTS